ncbi:MAG: periplasmic heavy metal sensor [Candidatus Coatesbacteria bacterium]
MNGTTMRRFGIALAAVLLMAPLALAATTDPAGAPGRPGKLTAEQKEKLKSLREEQKKAMQPLRRALKTQVDELRVLLDKDASDSALNAKLEEIRKTRTAIRELEEKFMAQTASILPARQRAEQVVRMADRMGKPGRKPGMGKRGGPGGPMGGRPGERHGPEREGDGEHDED